MDLLTPRALADSVELSAPPARRPTTRRGIVILDVPPAAPLPPRVRRLARLDHPAGITLIVVAGLAVAVALAVVVAAALGGGADAHHLDPLHLALFAAISALLIGAALGRGRRTQAALLTEVRRAYDALRQSEARLAEAQALAHLGTWHVWFGRDEEPDQWTLSREVRRLYGYVNTQEIDLKPGFDLTPEEDRDPLEHSWRRARQAGGTHEWEHRVVVRGELRWVHVHARFVLSPDGAPLEAFGTTQDITDRKVAAQRIEFLASHDRLTELPSREQFFDRLSQAVSAARRNGTRLAVMFLDLDGFKPINDRHGHDAGDAVLRAVARRLRASLRTADPAPRATDLVARLGGDEFCVLLGEIADPDAARRVAEKLIARVGEPIQLGDHATCQVGVSVGIATYPDHGAELDTLMNAADAAMYLSKARGKNTATLADPIDEVAPPDGSWLTLPPTHTLGVKILDQQHRTLAQLLNRLNLLVKRGAAVADGADLLGELLRYAALHFATEERLMAKTGYPDAEVHRAAHQRHLEEAVFLRRKFAQGGELVVLQAVKDWLLTHVLDADAPLAAHLRQHGR
jgi:diguanylate cyclase (GGDEF)-like protein/hemerythrin-like metal-binding protein/PAS domain S-box-containing protein